MTYEYIPFVQDTEVNRQALRQGLTVLRPDYVGAIPRWNKMDELQKVVPEDCFPSYAELYPDGSANVFVRPMPGSPPVGFIRVRPEEVTP